MVSGEDVLKEGFSREICQFASVLVIIIVIDLQMHVAHSYV